MDRKQVKLIIFGSAQSKANSRRLVTFGGRPRIIKSKPALQFEKDVKAQVQPMDEMLEGDLSFHADIYYPSRRQDLDPSILLDALQGLIYANDVLSESIEILLCHDLRLYITVEMLLISIKYKSKSCNYINSRTVFFTLNPRAVAVAISLDSL